MPTKEQEKLREIIQQVMNEELERKTLESDIDKGTVSVEMVREIIREELPTALAKSITSIEGNLQLLDGRNIIVGGTNGSKIGTASTQKLGFFNQTPAIQPTNGVNLTNNVTAGGVNDTIANFTDLSTYANDAAAIRNDIYQLAKKLKVVNDALRTLGLNS